MNNQPYISSTDEPTTFLNGKQLAKVLEISPPSLSEAARNGYNSGGYPVSEWAEETGTGRIKGYHVPKFLVNDEAIQKPVKRANPKSEATNNDRLSPNKAKTIPNKDDDRIPADLQAIIDKFVNGQPPTVDVQKSVLPPDQNYAEPVGMVSLASILKKALEANIPESRMLIFASMIGFGGLVGHTVNDTAGAPP